ncbi:hypothetical protein ACFSZS_07450 [Seohaeicola zhoushanensis]
MEFHAGFAEATDAYGHNIMGRLQDMRLLTIHVTQAGSDRTTCPAEALLPEDEVFEDIAPASPISTVTGCPRSSWCKATCGWAPASPSTTAAPG